jgi:hypothetical protein
MTSDISSYNQSKNRIYFAPKGLSQISLGSKPLVARDQRLVFFFVLQLKSCVPSPCPCRRGRFHKNMLGLCQVRISYRDSQSQNYIRTRRPLGRLTCLQAESEAPYEVYITVGQLLFCRYDRPL